MISVAVLQARTTSSRLPGKVLLPVNGIPLAVLAAKRAANTGRNVIVATSLLASDDGLADTIEANGLVCFRGSLDNPLERMVHALEGYSDDTIVFRLTADNIFPDGNLLDEMEKVFLQGGYDYLCCGGIEAGLPYGVSAEATRLRHLRWALGVAVDSFDKEHVTPLIIRRFGVSYFDRYKSLSLGLLRCTVDNLDDYLLVCDVLKVFKDPINISYKELILELSNCASRPIVDQPVNKLVFGAAQLGLEYGVNNHSGRPCVALAGEMLRMAIVNGVEYIDTARAYGVSEAVVGAAINGGWKGRASVITKLSPLSDCPEHANSAWVRSAVDASIFESCYQLGLKELSVVMLHRAVQLEQWGGAAWHRLIELQKMGVIKAIGVSVQNPSELQRALEEPLIGYVQLPCNLLDWRWDDMVSLIEKVKLSRPLIVHVRSGLLQGLLVSNSEGAWNSAHVNDSTAIREWLSAQTISLGCSNVADLCMAYLRGLSWVDGIALGMENSIQVAENIRLFAKPPLNSHQISMLQTTRPLLSEQTLNPAYWLSDKK